MKKKNNRKNSNGFKAAFRKHRAGAANDNFVPSARERGLVEFTLTYNGVTKTWAATPKAVEDMAAVIEKNFGETFRKDRCLAAEHVFAMIDLGLHHDHRCMTVIAGVASWLVMTGEGGDEILSGECTHCRFDTLPPEGPDHRAVFVMSTANFRKESAH